MAACRCQQHTTTLRSLLFERHNMLCQSLRCLNAIINYKIIVMMVMVMVMVVVVVVMMLVLVMMMIDDDNNSRPNSFCVHFVPIIVILMITLPRQQHNVRHNFWLWSVFVYNVVTFICNDVR